MKRRDVILGLAIAACAAAALLCLPFLIEQKTGPRAASTAFSSGIFPTAALTAILLSGVGLACQAWLGPQREEPPAVDPAGKKAVLGAMAVSLAYALFMPFLGFVTATVPAMILVFRLFGLPQWWRGFLFSAAFTAAIYAVLAVFLRVPVPTGLWL